MITGFSCPASRTCHSPRLPSKGRGVAKSNFAIELLHYIAQTNIRLQATKVELLVRRPDIDRIDLDFIDFLAPFEGLEDLFVMFESDYADIRYANTILRHRDTLRRLVFHKRYYYCL